MYFFLQYLRVGQGRGQQSLFQ